MSDKKKTNDAAGKKTVVSLSGLRAESGASESPANTEDYLRDPEAMIRHITNVATVDLGRADKSPDKPATRVSSLASFRSPSTESPFVVKRTTGEAAEPATSDAGNVRAFPKTTDQSRKK